MKSGNGIGAATTASVVSNTIVTLLPFCAKKVAALYGRTNVNVNQRSFDLEKKNYWCDDPVPHESLQQHSILALQRAVDYRTDI